MDNSISIIFYRHRLHFVCDDLLGAKKPLRGTKRFFTDSYYPWRSIVYWLVKQCVYSSWLYRDDRTQHLAALCGSCGVAVYCNEMGVSNTKLESKNGCAKASRGASKNNMHFKKTKGMKKCPTTKNQCLS